jgi:hypothetical protein
MTVAKFWTGGFVLSFVLTCILGIMGGLYFLMISGLTERSNPLGSVFALTGLLLVLSPLGLWLGRFLVLRSRR